MTITIPNYEKAVLKNYIQVDNPALFYSIRDSCRYYFRWFNLCDYALSFTFLIKNV